jgi:hypothetical protein
MPAFRAEIDDTYIQFMGAEVYQCIRADVVCLARADERNSSEEGRLTDFTARMAENYFDVAREGAGTDRR